MDLNNMKLFGIEEAMKSHCNFQHGSLIVYKGRIVAAGHNDNKCHSEENAIDALRRLLCRKGV